MSRFAGSDQRLYLKVNGYYVEGLLKVGPKHLFYRDFSGKCKEMYPLCVLDFYVHESCQRKGIGKGLFMKMLACEKISPAKIAYDRPSPKLIKFLEKHFELKDFVPQNNNFVIFKDFFTGSPQSTIDRVGGRARGTFHENLMAPAAKATNQHRHTTYEATGLNIGGVSSEAMSMSAHKNVTPGNHDRRGVQKATPVGQDVYDPYQHAASEKPQQRFAHTAPQENNNFYPEDDQASRQPQASHSNFERQERKTVGYNIPVAPQNKPVPLGMSQAERVRILYEEDRKRRVEGSSGVKKEKDALDHFHETAATLNRFEGTYKNVYPKGRNAPYNPLYEKQIQELE